MLDRRLTCSALKIVGFVFTVLVWMTPLAGHTQPLANETWVYSVLRDGNPIGTHSIAFNRQGETTTVQIKTELAVQIAFITAFRYEHESTETWKGKKLASLVSKTNDDGTHHNVSVTAAKNALSVTADSTEKQVPADILLHNQWNLDNLTRKTLLSPFDGKVLNISFAGPTNETIEINGKSFDTRRYTMSGDLERTFWYNTKGQLVRTALKSRGSDIAYELR
ncbi:hypothetical protein HEQ63_00430 [Haematospirillum jordaniae]|uniref:DUF6134 family protein n=1 Tax=Haematospirillum jordaniae TaxID=1549855 RepID=UPI001432FA7A|nr:DUF6134 family protein [Haematospirillum jordaniae]NKD84659.1 hypothetical protein [Haematospirillum jordaniae]